MRLPGCRMRCLNSANRAGAIIWFRYIEESSGGSPLPAGIPRIAATESMKMNPKQNKGSKILEEAGAEEQSDAQQSSRSAEHKPGFPIVGIGASAGGLEAFTAFLRALSPNLGMSFVFVPHLDPSRESAFTQILARETSMPVHAVTNDMQVERK